MPLFLKTWVRGDSDAVWSSLMWVRWTWYAIWVFGFFALLTFILGVANLSAKENEGSQDADRERERKRVEAKHGEGTGALVASVFLWILVFVALYVHRRKVKVARNSGLLSLRYTIWPF